MCEYGNCREEEKLPIVVSVHRAVPERKRFCSEYHGALWLLRWAKIREQNLNRRMSASALLDAAYTE